MITIHIRKPHFDSVDEVTFKVENFEQVREIVAIFERFCDDDLKIVAEYRYKEEG